LAELRPYATHEIYSFVLAERLIEKVLEEHNFMKLYSKLVKRLKKCVV
jgi:metal-dependent HD superfamily phosphatase/phosphodiesterase